MAWACVRGRSLDRFSLKPCAQFLGRGAGFGLSYPLIDYLTAWAFPWIRWEVRSHSADANGNHDRSTLGDLEQHGDSTLS